MKAYLEALSERPYSATLASLVRVGYTGEKTATSNPRPFEPDDFPIRSTDVPALILGATDTSSAFNSAYLERFGQRNRTFKSKMAKTKKTRLQEAKAHLARARKQWDAAAVDSWPPEEPADCVTKCFYSYENALVAAATVLGTAWTKKHYEKADLAKRLFEQNKLKTDVSDLLVRLNELRKDVSYGEPGDELSQVDLEDLVSELESFLDEVDELVASLEEE